MDETNPSNDDNGDTLSLLVIELAYVIKTVVFSDHWSLNSDDECKFCLEIIKLYILSENSRISVSFRDVE